MTLVKMAVQRPGADGLVSSGGRAEWRPTARRVEGDAVVMPAAFSVELTDGVADVLVAPSGPGWCWEVTEYVKDGTTRYVAVPDVESIAYTDLIDVDPATLDPAAEPTAVWWAVAESMAVSGVEAVEAAGVATAAADAAVGVADALPGQASAAVAAEVVAQVDPKVVAAAGSAAASAGSAAQAVQAKVAAEAARDRAEAVPTTSDGIMASVASTPGSVFGGVLKSTIGDLVDPVAAEVVAAQVVTQIDPKVTTATDAATTATTKAGEASASATTAQQWVEGFTAGTATPLAAGAAPTLAITGPAGAKVLDLGIPAGAKGDPGGWVRATILAAGVNANSVTAPGLYTAIGVNTTLALNFPFDQVAVNIAVIERDANIRTQTAYVVALGANSQKGIAQRSNISGIWGEWDYYVPTMTSQAAGRAISTWDSINRRYQLIYGDTGVRNIKGDMANGWTAAIACIMRKGSRVTLGLFAIDPSAKTDPSAYLVPLGFRPASMSGNFEFSVRLESGVASTIIYNGTAGAMQPPGSARCSTGAITLFSWDTNDPWPTLLPGSALGTIPSL